MSQKPRDKHEHGGHPKKPPGTHNNSPEELAAINETLIAFSKKYEEGQEKNPSRERWKFGMEVCTVIGIGIYTLITGGLFIASLYQIGIMQDTEHRQLRAYLHVARASVTYVEVVSGPLKVSVTPTYKVYGQTPAGSVVPKWNLTVQPLPMTDRFPFDLNSFPATTTTVDAPGEERIMDTKDYVLPVEDIAKLNAGTHRLFIYGTILYVDVFKISRYTNFCFYLDIPGIKKRQAANCEIHNGADWFASLDQSTPITVPMR